MPRAEAVVANIERRVDYEAERIAAVLEWWLYEEANRPSDNNAYLDDFSGFVQELYGAADSLTAVSGAKSKSHRERLISWTRQTEEAEDELTSEDFDYLLARQLFGVLMLTSGNLRKQALLCANSQEEYTQYRTESTLVGAGIKELVKDRVWWHRAEKQQLPLEQEQEALFTNTLVVNDLANEWVSDFLYSRGKHEAGRIGSEAHIMGHVTEQAWIELIVDYIYYMDLRNLELGRIPGYDGFANVPFLEPKSITLDPKMIYPFSEVA